MGKFMLFLEIIIGVTIFLRIIFGVATETEYIWFVCDIISLVGYWVRNKYSR